MIHANNNFYFNGLWKLNVQELSNLPFTKQISRPVAPTFTSETSFAAMGWIRSNHSIIIIFTIPTRKEWVVEQDFKFYSDSLSFFAKIPSSHPTFAQMSNSTKYEAEMHKIGSTMNRTEFTD